MTPASATMGIPNPPKATGSRVGNQRDDDRSARLKAETDQQTGGYCDRRSETRAAFQERSEAESHQYCLNASVSRGVLFHPAAKQLKFARVLREVVEPEAAEDNPQNRPERIDKPIGGAPQQKR